MTGKGARVRGDQLVLVVVPGGGVDLEVAAPGDAPPLDGEGGDPAARIPHEAEVDGRLGVVNG